MLTSAMLAACGGGSGSARSCLTSSIRPSPTASSAPTTSTQSAAIQFQLSQQPSTATLPALGGYTSHVSFPGLTMSPEPTIGIEPSTSAPPGAPTPQSLRRTQSGALTVFFFLTFTSPVTFTLGSVPGFSLDLPASFPTAGEQFFVALSDPTVLPTVQFRTQGPATVSGHTVTFASDSTPLTLQAGQKYVFAFFATSSGPVATSRSIFVSDSTGRVLSFPANGAGGNIAPSHTFAGQTGLTSLAVGPTGDAFAGKLAPPQIFDLSPALTLNGSITPPDPHKLNSVRVDANGFIYEAGSKVGVFAPGTTGAPPAFLRTISVPAAHTAGDVFALGFDEANDLYVGSGTVKPNTFFIDVFAPNAAGTDAPQNTLLIDANQFHISPVSGFVDSLARMYFADPTDNTIYVFALAGCTSGTILTPTRTISGAQTLLNSPDGIAVDAAGNIFVANFGGNQILEFGPNANGNAAPAMVIGGANTTLSFPIAIAVSP
ncbi:MAG: SMP-30/gluconolactonase/LRE family protein [Candidatus Velthaea sp.]